MAIKSKREVAQVLHTEANGLLRHGFTNFFNHSFACLLGQIPRVETCQGCLLGDYVPVEYREETFPCQPIAPAHWEEIADVPGLPARIATRWLSIAEELEASAEAEEAMVETQETS